MSDQKPQSIHCPTCGAPLDYDGKSSTVRCNFCKSITLMPVRQPTRETPQPVEPPSAFSRLAESANVLEGIKDLLRAGNKIEAIKRYRQVYDVGLAEAKDAVEQIEASLPPRAIQPVIEITRSGKGQSCSLVSIISVAVMLLGVGGILVYFLSLPGSPLVPRMVVSGPAILLPSAQGDAPDVAVLLYNVNKETRSIGLLDSSTHKLLWQTQPLPGDGYVETIVPGEDLIYATIEAGLFAYRLNDGSLAWQTEMTDRLYSRENNLLVSGERVIALTLDQTLQAYDTQTGKLAWSRRMAGYDRQLRMMGGSLVILDYLNGGYTYNIMFLDPADGREQRTITPLCQRDEYYSETMDTNSGIVYDPAGNALYLAFGSYPGCVQRYDLRSGQLVWQTIDEKGFSFSSYGFNGLQTSDTLFFNNDHQLLSVDKSTGMIKLLLEDEDYEFVPLAISGDTLIVRTRRSRGSERFELWGLDRHSGERQWGFDFEKAKPLDAPNELSGLVDQDDPGWTWRMMPAGFLLLEFQAEPNRLVLTMLNPANGVSLGEGTTSLKGLSSDFYSVPTILGWEDNRVYFVMDSKIYAVDAATGEVLFRYQ